MAPERGGSVRRSRGPTTSREVSFGPGERQTDRQTDKTRGSKEHRNYKSVIPELIILNKRRFRHTVMLYCKTPECFVKSLMQRCVCSVYCQ